MKKFKASIEIIGINPFVAVPEKILLDIFKQAGKEKGAIPIYGSINEKIYKQTLVRYAGAWRLYINTSMLSNSPKRIGETISVTVAFDPVSRAIKPHPKLLAALKADSTAKKTFDALPASRRKEIVRYIAALKTEATIVKNINKAINFLNGKERFIGRDKP